ncbi:TRAP transporter substrate-binding protein [Pseudohoeflea coraliihabitans]|uniref:TRAP transporter substrate-binding protein n=1 Tax=Pseudohoeflea coraliihabitans TaxID=2860393 RepID=A0ABS6WIU4_9HYPH|nr:TRAP transporter substrate-binding protein [Pseudohoeflea sp. DP4N28-3]MBW3095846.1 TRAP transporter substrate-binding protein [Pseudohoeflea sp. DP4N28-3]
MRIFKNTAFASAALMAAALYASTAMAEVKLRLAVETTSGDPTNVMLAEFRDNLAEAAGDEVEIEFFDGGSLGDEFALVEMLRVNQAQVVPLGSDGVVQLAPQFAIFDAPYLFTSKQQARDALAGDLGAKLTEVLRESANLEVLAFGEIGVRVVSNNTRPVETPEDLKGLKLRTPGSPTRIMAFTKLGASPVQIDLGDVYLALRQGTIDGQENPMSVIKEFSLHEVQKYISLTNHVYTPVTLAMNGDAYDALSDEMKTAVKDAAKAAATVTHENSDKQDAELVAIFEEAGVTVNAPDLAPFQEASAEIHEEIGKVVGEDFMADVKSSINE